MKQHELDGTFQEFPAETPPANYADIAQADILKSLRFREGSLPYRLMSLFSRNAIIQLSQFLTEMDAQLVHSPINFAALSALKRLTAGLIAHNEPEAPASGPVLVVGNHPGWVDSITALASMKRPDIHIVAGTHSTLQFLPRISKQLIFVDQNAISLRANVIREVISLLQAGKAVIVFPRGVLEPDPALLCGAKRSIGEWKDSIGIFLQKVPETVIQPMLLSHMVHPKAWGNRVISLIKDQRRRQQLATAMQFALSLRKNKGAFWKVTPQVRFGQAMQAKDISKELDARKISHGIQQEMLALLGRAFPNMC
ncbi:MAG: 1-acyl-sn-glycerol-3-phosphate acyltransferase [Anaerolineaceae bacterium]|nr:1-acyl-sn-glycerol-3-phosphate acyltransferase [Anaerolineaceae bacterium]